MSKKKKNHLPPPEASAKAKAYLDVWILMNRATLEKEIDQFRRDLAQIWSTLSDNDKKDFCREATLYENAHRAEFKR
jgi:hypothetical protein